MKQHRETVYLGIDVHKKTYAVTAIAEGDRVKTASLPASPNEVVKFCRKAFPEAQVVTAYEAGFSGFVLFRHLQAQGIECRVVHPASIEISARDRVKTDRRDSMKIATQLKSGRLRGIHVPSDQRERYRILSRLREDLQGERTRVANKLKSLLLCHGLLGPDDDCKVSIRWIDALTNQTYPQEIARAIEVLTDTWKYFYQKITEVQSQLQEQALEDSDLERTYRSAPGIGPIVARTLANELGDMSQFGHEKQLFSYLGLTPSEYSSGPHIRRGHISRQGKSILRKVLVQAAWRAIRQDARLLADFQRLSATRGKKRAIVAVARRLAGRIRSCFRTGQEYKVEPIEEKQQAV